MKYSLEMTVQR